MRAIRLLDSKLSVCPDHPLPHPKSDESLVRVSMAGICSTDLELIKGYFGFEGTLGHEFVGTVEQSNDPAWVRQRVVSTINFADPRTPEFAKYGFHHHPDRSVLGILGRDGAMADYVAVPTRHLLAVPEGVPDRDAVFTEPLAAALRIAEQVVISPDAPVAVIGAGRLGMLIGKVLALGGASVVMLARRASALELPRQWGLETSLVDEAQPDRYQLVVEATGNSGGLEHALRIVQPLGTIVLKSTYAEAPAVDLTKVVVGEVRLIGSRCGPFAPALRLLQQQSVDVHSLIAAEYSADQALQAFEHAARPAVRKVLLDFRSDPRDGHR